MTVELIHSECLRWMRRQDDFVCDLALFSPPYVDARTYGIDFNLTGEDYVEWLKKRIVECLRITRGLVVCVVEGKTEHFSYDATPMLVAADLKRAGIILRKPPLYVRDGIPGSGGPDWLANKYEFCICCTHGGKLPWSDNTAMGHPPLYGPGGPMSYRSKDGRRINGKGKTKDELREFGVIVGGRQSRTKDGRRVYKNYVPPEISNPGNLIDCGSVGGGAIGHKIAHENEAPFPEYLAEFFTRSFCPSDGTVLDICCGSGTTLAVAKKFKRNAIGVDIRKSQIKLSRRRVDSTIEGFGL